MVCVCAQSCLTFCDQMDYRHPPGSSIHGISHGLPFPFLGDLSDPGIEPVSPASPALAGRFFTNVPPGKPSGVRMGKRSFTI